MIETIIGVVVSSENDDDEEEQDQENNHNNSCNHNPTKAERALRQLHHHLKTILNASSTSTSTTLKQALGNNNNTASQQQQQLPMALTTLIAHRRDATTLLPATQDERANLKALESNAITISSTALYAGNVYAQMVGSRGSLGLGIVNVAALYGTAALLRRWGEECRTIVSSSSLLDFTTITSSKQKKKKKKGIGKRRNSAISREQRYKKRRVAVTDDYGSHNNNVSSSDGSDGSDDEEEAASSSSLVILAEHDNNYDDDDGSVSNNRTGSAGAVVMGEEQFIMAGLQMAQSLARAPCLMEFQSWSCEAREAVLDALTCALAISSALTASGSGGGGGGACASNKRPLVQLCREVTSCVSDCLVMGACRMEEEEEEDYHSLSKSKSAKMSVTVVQSGCEDTETDDVDDNDNEGEEVEVRCNTTATIASSEGDAAYAEAEEQDQDRKQEIIISILRGLLKLLLMQVEVPFGQKGRINAHNAAGKVLRRIIEKISSNLKEQDSASALSKPSSGRKSTSKRGSVTFSGNRTPGRGRTRSPAHQRPPSLKKTPRGRSLTPSRMTPRGTMPSAMKIMKYTASPNTTSKARLPRPVLCAAVGMLQKLSTSKGLERADARTRLALVVTECLPVLPVFERAYFIRFILQLCRSKKSSYRIFAVELLSSITLSDWLWADHSDNGPEKIDLVRTPVPPSEEADIEIQLQRSSEVIHIPGVGQRDSSRCISLACVTTLFGRLHDRVPAVRARAAVSISESLLLLLNEDADIDQPFQSWTALHWLTATTKALQHEVSLSFRRRLSDKRATVRRAAISGLSSAIMLSPPPSPADIRMLGELCNDSSVTVRKSAGETLTSLLHGSATNAEVIQSTWTESVLTLVFDQETTCSSKAVDFVFETLLKPIIIGEDDPMNEIAWKVLHDISMTSHEVGTGKGAVVALKLTIKKLIERDGSIVKSLLRLLQQVCKDTLNLDSDQEASIDSDCDGSSSDLFCAEVEKQRNGAWCLLSALCDMGQYGAKSSSFNLLKVVKACKVHGTFITSAWKKFHELSASDNTPSRSLPSLRNASKSCLCIMSKLGRVIPVDEARDVSNVLQNLIVNFELPPDLIGPATGALVSLTLRYAEEGLCDGKEGNARESWIECILRSCEKELDKFVGTGSCKSSITIDRAIYTVGECVMVGFSSDNDNAVTDGKKILLSKNPVKGLHVKPSSALVRLIQVMLSPTLPPVQDLPERENKNRTHAFTTLGKLCIRDAKLAKNCVNLFARELYSEEGHCNPSVQSNALLVLGDLCVRYTNIVDLQLPAMAACLQSGIKNLGIDSSATNDDMQKSALVRKHAVLLLSSLLLQDFIKFRGLLLFRFLAATIDDDEGVAILAEMTVCGPLLSKQSNLFINNFVEALFIFNDCKAHPIFAATSEFSQNVNGTNAFDGINLFGSSGKPRRMTIYRMMLSHMSDEQKIALAARFAKEILVGALECDAHLSDACKPLPSLSPGQKIPLQYTQHENAINVLSDAFAILTDPLIRVGRSTSVNDTDIGDDVNTSTTGPAASQVAVVKSRLLTKISRKHLIESVVPILCSLKKVLEANRSPLLKNLMHYLHDIFRQHKNDAREALATDPDLQKEIDYDLKRYEKLRKEQQSSLEDARAKSISSSCYVQARNDQSVEPLQMRQPQFASPRS